VTFPLKGSYVLVLYGPSAMDREHPRGRTLMVRDGKRNKVKPDEFAARAGGARISGLVSSGRTLVDCRRVALGNHSSAIWPWKRLRKQTATAPL
jgi:hypothetical protein